MINDNPENAWWYLYLGSAWICKDSLERAEIAFEKAREINPKWVFNLYRLAHTYRLQKRFIEAINILKEILKYDQEEVSAYFDMGINYQGLGNLSESRKCFLKFKEIASRKWLVEYPNYPETYFALSAISARLGDLNYSEQMLKRATDLDSAKYQLITDVYCLQGRIPESLSMLRKSLEKGYRDLFWLKVNPDLQNIFYDIRYRELINEYFNK